jgi:hypothetical protein
MRRAIPVLLLILALPRPAAAFQQTDRVTIQSKALLSKAPDPTVTNGIVTPDAKFTLAAGPDAKEAKVQIGVQTGGLTTSLSFKGKLADKGDSTLLGLTGLPSDASGAIAFSYTRWNPTVNEARALAVCEAYTSRRLSLQRAAIGGDQSLQVGQTGAWSINLAGEAGQITWEFDDGVKDYGRTAVSHAFEKAGVHQIKATVVRENTTSVRSLLVAVSSSAVAPQPFRIEQRGPNAPHMSIGRQVPFALRSAASATTIVDYGDGASSKVAVGSSGAIDTLHAYNEPGDFIVSAGVEVADGQFAIVSNATRVLDDCSISAMGSEPDLQREHALAVNWSLPLIVAAKYEMGRSSFDFVDAKTGAEQPAAIRTPLGASGTVGTIFESGVAVAISIERQRSYRAGKSAQLCTDFSELIVKCGEVVLGGPSTSDATIASISLQRSGRNVGVQPRLAYRWTKSGRTTSVDVPVYVLQNKDGGLNGGVSLGWRTKEGTRAVLFVGVMTDLFQRK